MNKKVFVAIAVLLAAVLACTFGGPTSPTQVPTTGGGGSTGPTVLFQDNFSSTSSGWDRTTDASYTTDYTSGGYHISVTPENYSAFANPYKIFPNDVRIEVDATKAAGPDDNSFGVQCRYQDTQNYYFFYISSDGYTGIGIDKAGTKSIISSSDGNLISDSNINQGSATNHIRADCIGSTLTLYVNGTQIATATDSSFSGGDVGLMARSFTTGGVDILFTNFFVYKP
jgi:pectate lyase